MESHFDIRRIVGFLFHYTINYSKSQPHNIYNCIIAAVDVFRHVHRIFWKENWWGVEYGKRFKTP